MCDLSDMVSRGPGVLCWLDPETETRLLASCAKPRILRCTSTLFHAYFVDFEIGSLNSIPCSEETLFPSTRGVPTWLAGNAIVEHSQPCFLISTVCGA